MMRAAIFEKPGLENLKVTVDAEEPKLTDHDVLIKVKAAGVNSIDQAVVSGRFPAISPMPHIPRSRNSWHCGQSRKPCSRIE